MGKQPRRLCIVGPGTRFLSGITYYTFNLCNALSGAYDVSVVLMRQLLPTRLYPGRSRVGAPITRLELGQSIARFDGVDWYWIPSLLRALRFTMRGRPSVLILQWWTGTVFHTYLVLVTLARLLGAQVVIEFHEVLDTGEDRIPIVRTYARLMGKLLVHLADGFVIHSEHDRPALEEAYKLTQRPVAVIPHGPYGHYRQVGALAGSRAAPSSCCNLLFFGTIRPYKGLEDLIRVFDALPEQEISGFWLTVVGETWEGWLLPTTLIEQSRYRDRITFVNHYVTDEEAADFFAGADAVVLPYHRSSASGPLHISMNYGLPVITTDTGGLGEAVEGYKGAILVPPKDARSLRAALIRVAEMKGRHFSDPHSWSRTVTQYEALFVELDRRRTVNTASVHQKSKTKGNADEHYIQSIQELRANR